MTNHPNRSRFGARENTKMITKSYNNTPMTDLSEVDYGTLLMHLSEQVAGCIPGYGDQAHDAASDILTNTWQPELTAREWLALAGERLGVSTDACVGA
jgi:hypothetical protein